MRYILILCLLIISCGYVEDTAEPQENKPSELWVCYNPMSEYHGSVCTDECYYTGFMKDRAAFCWLMGRTECERPLEFAWQEENCHLFGPSSGTTKEHK